MIRATFGGGVLWGLPARARLLYQRWVRLLLPDILVGVIIQFAKWNCKGDHRWGALKGCKWIFKNEPLG